jgi:hypothetical protein
MIRAVRVGLGAAVVVVGDGLAVAVAVVALVVGETVTVSATCRSSTGAGVLTWLMARTVPPPMAPAATSERTLTVAVRVMLIRCAPHSEILHATALVLVTFGYLECTAFMRS